MPVVKSRRKATDDVDQADDVVLHKCPECGFWTGVATVDNRCPECGTELKQDVMSAFYPY